MLFCTFWMQDFYLKQSITLWYFTEVKDLSTWSYPVSVSIILFLFSPFEVETWINDDVHEQLTASALCEDEEAVTFLTFTLETNRNVRFPSCSPRGFPSFELWLELFEWSRFVLFFCGLMAATAESAPPALFLHQPVNSESHNKSFSFTTFNFS